MAIIKCRECQCEISDRAEICPKCGCPAKRRRKYLDWGAIIIAIISIVGSYISTTTSSRYAADATVEAAKINVFNELDKSTDLGNALYRERSIYKGKGGEDYAVKTYPYADHDINNTLQNYTTEEFIIDAAVTNLYNNLWYRLDNEVYPKHTISESGQAYVFSGNLVYVADAAEVYWPDKLDNAQIPEGSSQALKGELVCTNRISKITAEIFQVGKPFRVNTELFVNENDLYSYSMSDSELNNWYLSKLPVGKDYKLILQVEYLTNGDKDRGIQKITSSFDIISSD